MALAPREPIPFLALKDGLPLQGATLSMINKINSAPVKWYADRTSATVVTDPNLMKSGADGQYVGFVEPDDIKGTAVHALGTYEWEWQPNNNYLNVRHFGARGDGVTDDRAAFQACINASASMGAWMFIPPGDYMLHLPVSPGPLDLLPGTRIMGCGDSSLLIRTTNPVSDRPVFNVLSSTANNIALVNFAIDYNGAANPGASGPVIKIDPAGTSQDVVIDGVRVKNTINPHAFAIKVSRVKGLAITNCYLEDLRKDGIHIEDCQVFVIANNRIVRSGIDSANSKTGSGTGDDHIALSFCEDGVVTGNVCESPNQGAGRGIWVLGSKRISIIGNSIRAGWRANISLESIANEEMGDIVIAGNLLQRAGEWNSTSLWGDAISILSSNYAAGAGQNGPIRRVIIADNIIDSPRRHGIWLSCTDAVARIEGLTIQGNMMNVDRALTHYGIDFAGRFFYANLADSGQAGEIADLSFVNNTSYNAYQHGIYLQGLIKRTRIIGDRHFNCGRNTAKRAGFHFDSITGLHMESCYVGDFSGEARTDLGARFLNLVTSSPARIRIVDNDFRDTITPYFLKTGSLAATDGSELRGNFPAVS